MSYPSTALFNGLDTSIAIPCSVKAYGGCLRPLLQFEVTNCDPKLFSSLICQTGLQVKSCIGIKTEQFQLTVSNCSQFSTFEPCSPSLQIADNSKRQFHKQSVSVRAVRAVRDVRVVRALSSVRAVRVRRRRPLKFRGARFAGIWAIFKEANEG